MLRRDREEWEEGMERAEQCILKRQSSYETHMVPQAPLPVSDSDDDEEFATIAGPSCTPRITRKVFDGSNESLYANVYAGQSDEEESKPKLVDVKWKTPPPLQGPSKVTFVPRVRVIREKDDEKDADSDSHSNTLQMAMPGTPKSLGTPKKDDESFWEKFGTIGRKKKIKEIHEIQEEGKYAIDSPGLPKNVELPPEEYALDENDQRSMIEPRSYNDPSLRRLICVLIDWINDELANHRIIVKDIEEDLYDGQVLHKLIEKLQNVKIDCPEVTQSEEGQRQKLTIVLNAINQILGLGRYSERKWTVESVHSKNVVSILHLLVALVRHFRAPVRLPENVRVSIVVVEKKDGQLFHKTIQEEITSTYDELGLRLERDAFDTLHDHAPDKLQVVKRSLISFVNKHLNRINLEVTDLDRQFHDGVYLVLLMGLLEGYFVPLYSFHLTTKDFDQKVHNVSFAFELMQDAGLPKPKARPEDIVNFDLKSTLRVLYNLFAKYKNAA